MQLAYREDLSDAHRERLIESGAKRLADDRDFTKRMKRSR
jgi:hypothetical protein